DAAIRRIDGWIGDGAQAGLGGSIREVPTDRAELLRTRLLLLRQAVIAGQPDPILTRALDDVQAARQPLRPEAGSRAFRPEAIALEESLGQAAARIRDSLKRTPVR